MNSVSFWNRSGSDFRALKYASRNRCNQIVTSESAGLKRVRSMRREGFLHAGYASFGNARRARAEAIGMPATRHPRQLPGLFSARAPKSTANWLRDPEIF